MAQLRRARRMMFPAMALAALLVWAADGGAIAKSPCKAVKGSVVFTPVPAPDCLAATGVCAATSWSGKLKGQGSLTVTSFIPTADTPTTAVLLITADSQIQTESGDLLLKDAGSLRTTGDSDFVDLAVIVGGTDSLNAASGTLHLVGSFTADGEGAADYSGTVCVAQ
jgi:hypothetical protein